MAGIVLLSTLDSCYKDAREWFDTNLQLNFPLPSLNLVARLIMGDQIMDCLFYRESLSAFRQFKYGDARGGVPPAPEWLESRLDGEYWSKK